MGKDINRHSVEEDIHLALMVSATGLGGGSGSHAPDACHPGPRGQRRLAVLNSMVGNTLCLACQ